MPRLDIGPDPNDALMLTVRELRIGAAIYAEKTWPAGSPGGSDSRHEFKKHFRDAIDAAVRQRGEQA